jgi:hypothetical protein
MGQWTVTARLGDDTYTQQRDWDEDPTLPCLLGVAWSHELDSGVADTWPIPDLLTTATVTLLVEQASDAAHYDPTTTVHLEFYADAAATTVVDTFSGRGSFPLMEAHPQGVLVTITVVSYLLDLDAYMTGGGTMPAEQTDARLNRELGFGLSGDWMDLAARPVGAVSLLELARDSLYYGLADTEVNPSLPARWEMYQLVQNTDADGYLDPFFPWGVGELDQRVISTAPLRLRENPDDPGTYELHADPDDPAEYVIDAAEVALELQLGRAIGQSVNTVHVVMDDDTHVTATNHQEAGEYVIAAERETELADPAQGLILADYLLPEGTTPSEWEAEAVTVLLDHTPDGWYPPPLRTVAALGGIPRHYHPENLTYLVGVVSRVSLAVSQGVAVVTVKLDSRRIVSANVVSLSLDEVPQDIDTITGTIDSFINAG